MQAFYCPVVIFDRNSTLIIQFAPPIISTKLGMDQIDSSIRFETSIVKKSN